MLTTAGRIRIAVLMALAGLLLVGTADAKSQRNSKPNQRQESQNKQDNRADNRQKREPAEQRQNETNRQAAAAPESSPQRAQPAPAPTAQKEARKPSVSRSGRQIQPKVNNEQQQQNRPVVTRRNTKTRPVTISKAAPERKTVSVQQKPKVDTIVKAAPKQNSAPVLSGRKKITAPEPIQKTQPPADRKRTQVVDGQRRDRNITRDTDRKVNINRTINRDATTVPTRRDATVVATPRNVRTTAPADRRSFDRNTGGRPRHDASTRFSRPRAVKVVYPHREARHVGFTWQTRTDGYHSGSVFRHIVWPKYGYPVYYRHGPDIFVNYVRPSYHRKYVFVSIGNYWPVCYTNVRYYWYGWHPYSWYGSYPTAYRVGGDTYNYYTYNTYNSDTSQSYSTSEYAEPLQSVDETTFEDIRQKLAEQQQTEPDPETLSDKFFEDGVVAFEREDYATAAAAFADAIALEPNDLILPFAYVQALFATEQYSRAADILRLALEQMPANQQGLFFPRGLYGEDEILQGQIEKLQGKAEVFAYDPDMLLLLGYQLIGVEQYDQARQWLGRAEQYNTNYNAVTILTDLLNKVQEQSEGTSENI